MRKVLVTCPCGSEFNTTEKRISDGRGKYCSKPCMYKYRTRPSGLNYNIVSENKGWFKNGGSKKYGQDNPSWKGEDVSYKELHRWVAKYRQKLGKCEICGEHGYTEWANKSHEYKRDLNDWLELCRVCHRKHDSGENYGKAVSKYGRNGLN